MSENIENTENIWHEMRNYSNNCNDGYRTDYGVVRADMRDYADRLEAAYKREVADVKAKAALSVPRRNCDVGTVEEQTERYRKFCSAHKYLASDFTYLCKGFGKGRCPFSSSHTKSQCEFAWAQMPYEEGEADEQ